jgi:hypothetical protein
MADPVVVTLTADQWVICASNVTTGTIHVVKGKNVSYTYVDTGNPAPTTNAKMINLDGDQLDISSTVAIDVYLKSHNEAGEAIAGL